MGARLDHLDEIARAVSTVQLLTDDSIPRSLAGSGRTRHAEDYGVIGDTCDRARLNGGRTNLLVRDLAKQLAVALDYLVEQGQHGLWSGIPRGKSCTARDEYCVDVAVRDPLRGLSSNVVDVVPHDRATPATVLDWMVEVPISS